MFVRKKKIYIEKRKALATFNGYDGGQVFGYQAEFLHHRLSPGTVAGRNHKAWEVIKQRKASGKATSHVFC